MLKGAVFLRPRRSIARHGRIGKRGTQKINCLTCFSSWTLGCYYGCSLFWKRKFLTLKHWQLQWHVKKWTFWSSWPILGFQIFQSQTRKLIPPKMRPGICRTIPFLGAVVQCCTKSDIATGIPSLCPRSLEASSFSGPLRSQGVTFGDQIRSPRLQRWCFQHEGIGISWQVDLGDS